MIKTSKKTAILQIIPNHNSLLPQSLVRALVSLKHYGVDHVLYNIEATEEKDFAMALERLLQGIKEEKVVVSLSCHNNYHKIVSFLFFYLYLPLLKGKEVHICSPYLSFYDIKQLKSKNLHFHFLEIDEFVNGFFGLLPLNEGLFLKSAPQVIKNHGYDNYKYWSYLTFGCKFSCTFCYNRSLRKGDPCLIYGNPERIILWMRFAQSMGVKNFEFSDPNFLSDKEFTLAFLARLKKESLKLSWRCKIRLDHVNEDIYEKMIAAGCGKTYFGVEHVSPQVLKSAHKQEDVLPLLVGFLKYWKQKTILELSFMMGIKGETPALLQQNLALISKFSKMPRISTILAYTILFNEQRRKGAQENYLIPLLFSLNYLHGKKDVSPEFFRKLLFFCRKNEFFNFFFLTENTQSLELFKEMKRFYQANPKEPAIESYRNMFLFEGGAFADMIESAGSLDGLNRDVLGKLQNN
ncbi:MAG: radical SAM protein [Candidatus Omnitrophica bacterium]|nr:radical SAM protein [Candidatus Omnitrophota bacterium]